jgi:hypothetical protein
MNRFNVIKAAFFAALAIDMNPSRRNLEKMVKRITGGEGFSSREVSSWMRLEMPKFFTPSTEPFQNRKKTTSEPLDEHEPIADQNHSENQPRVRAVNVLVKRIIKRVSPTAQAQSEPTKTKPKRTKPSKIDLQWVEDMRFLMQAIATKPLVVLDADERFLLARYHAWRFANCTKDEGTNRSRASSIAAGITNLANHKDFCTMTAAEYVTQAKALWTKRGERPWYKPWDITSQFDPSDALKAKVLSCRAS